MTESLISITVDGTEHLLRARDLSAIDAQDFRAKVGLGIQEAVRSLDFDLDRVAGFVWLIRRRTDRGLTYESVARSLNYDTEVVVDLNPAAKVTSEGAGDPEA